MDLLLYIREMGVTLRGRVAIFPEFFFAVKKQHRRRTDLLPQFIYKNIRDNFDICKDIFGKIIFYRSVWDNYYL